MENNAVLLDMTPAFLVRALYFKNRILVCQTLQLEQIFVFYPGASKHKKAPTEAYYVLVKAYAEARPVCTHFLIAGDVRIHQRKLNSPLRQNVLTWCGFTTIYDNKLFKAFLDAKLHPDFEGGYSTEVVLSGSRIDFFLKNLQAYVQVKAEFVLWFKSDNSRFHKHLLVLNACPRSRVVFVTPYAWEFCCLTNPSYANKLSFLNTLNNITFYWLFVEYDRQGRIYYRKLLKPQLRVHLPGETPF